MTALERWILATTATTDAARASATTVESTPTSASSPTAQCPAGGTDVITDGTAIGSGFGPSGEPRRGGGGGVTSEQFSVAVFPVVGLALDPGLQEKVVAAVGHRLGQPWPCGDELFVGEPDRVARPGEEPLILQLLDDRLFCRGQPFAGHRPAGRETILAQGDEARQETLQDRSAIWREQRLGGLGPPDDRTLDPADPLVVGIGERAPALLLPPGRTSHGA